MKENLALLAGPVLFVIVMILPPPAEVGEAGRAVLAVSLWMALWWLTEAVAAPVAALLPLGLFPLLGVSPAQTVSAAYMDRNVVLFMGGFFVALAIQKWGLHRRIALGVLTRLGGRPARIVLGFMVATAFLSMWVSNLATTMMMLPIASAVVLHLKDRRSISDRSELPAVLMLGIAYAASIGGIATLIGTPPNIILASQYARLFPDRPEIGFLHWMAIGLPVAMLFIPAAWLYLTRFFSGVSGEAGADERKYLEDQRRSLGPMSREEKWVTGVFVATALGWIFRRNLELGSLTVPGWASLMGIEETTHDSTVAIVAALVLFAVPIRWKEPRFLMDWETAKTIPWGILILFGGGIALAGGIRDAGLAEWISGGLSVFSGLPDLVLIGLICLVVTFLTEITSNTAITTVLMPILGGMAVVLDVPPLLLMVPAAVSASCAFMLPVATPPNAIVFASGLVTTAQMRRAGLRLNLFGVVLTTLVVYLMLDLVFG